jgi:hypothetical protein
MELIGSRLQPSHDKATAVFSSSEAYSSKIIQKKAMINAFELNDSAGRQKL